MVHSTLNVSLSVPGLSEHRSSHRSLGSMGMTRRTRYVLVPRRRLVVQGCPRSDEVRHVRDVHPDDEGPVLARLAV